MFDNENNEAIEDMVEAEEAQTPSGESESKDAKFRRLANARVNKTLAEIDKIGNLANKSTYSYTDEQIEKIFSVLAERVESTKAKFKKEEKTEETFSL